MKLTIELKDNMLTMESSEPPTLHQVTSILLSTLLEAMHQSLNKATNKQDTKEYIFDQVNMAMSETLNRFAPDIELRPDITEEAIAELEFRNAFKKINSKKNSNDKMS